MTKKTASIANIETKKAPQQQPSADQLITNSSSPNSNNSNHLLSPPPRISTSSSICDSSDCCYSGYSSSSADYVSTGSAPTTIATVVTAATATTTLNKSSSISKKKILYKSTSNDFGGGLLSQVQKMQSLLEEYQNSLTALEIEKADHQQELLKLGKRLKAKGETEEGYKEQIWNLELCKQELIQKVQDLSQSLQRSNLEQARLEREQLDLEHIKAAWEQQTKEAQENHEQEIMSYRKMIQSHRLEKEALSKKIQELSQQATATTAAVTVATAPVVLRPVNVKNEIVNEEENVSNALIASSLMLLAPSNYGSSIRDSSLNNAALQIEALKTSLNQAHEIIQTMQEKLDKERDEKMQVDQLLRETQETIGHFHNHSQHGGNSSGQWYPTCSSQQASPILSSNLLSPISPLSSSYSVHSNSSSNKYRSRRSSSATNIAYHNSNSSKSGRKGRIFKVATARSSTYPVIKGSGKSLCDELSQAGSIGTFSGMIVAPESPVHIKVIHDDEDNENAMVGEEEADEQEDEEEVDEIVPLSPQSYHSPNNSSECMHNSETTADRKVALNIEAQHNSAPSASSNNQTAAIEGVAVQQNQQQNALSGSGNGIDNTVLENTRKGLQQPVSNEAHKDTNPFRNTNNATTLAAMDIVDQTMAETMKEVEPITSNDTQLSFSLQQNTSRPDEAKRASTVEHQAGIKETIFSPVETRTPTELAAVDLPSTSNHEMYLLFTPTTNSSSDQPSEEKLEEEQVAEQQDQVQMIVEQQQQQQRYGSLLKKENYIYKSRRQLMEEEQKRKKKEKKNKASSSVVVTIEAIDTKIVEDQDGKRKGRESIDDGSVTALTRTMIGDWMWKYTRKVVGSGISENSKHHRFFWIHPYTQTLYWSSQEPGSSNSSQSTSTTKSVLVESFTVLDNDSGNSSKQNQQPPSILIKTPSRGLKVQCMSIEAHDAWIKSLGLLLADNQQHDKDNKDEIPPKLSRLGSVSKYHYFNRKKSRQEQRNNKEIISLSSFPLPPITPIINNDELLLSPLQEPTIIGSSNTLLNNSTLVGLSNTSASKVITTA